MKVCTISIFIAILLLSLSNNSIAQVLSKEDSIYAYNNPAFQKKHPWDATLTTIGINVGVWAFNRYVTNEEFARIDFNTIWDNIKRGFVWDNDQFSTNLFAHPYHGSLYFNAARSNGYSFWGSAPFALGGSLMWEFAGEKEPAAINDLLATTIGGMALGEMTHRMSSLVLNDSKRGFNRFIREFLGTAICPMRGLNRMITGRMFKVRHDFYKYHNYEEIPVKFSIGSGIRYLADDNYLFKGEYNPYINLSMVYGDAFNKENDSPFDYFTTNISFGLSTNQPLINRISLIGKLWSKNVEFKKNVNMVIGIFQYFSYYDSERVINNSERIPYKISEAASIGPGIIYKFPKMNSLINLQQSLFLGGIILGGGLTDYYNFIDRNYNMGSGYSVKNNTLLDFGKYGSFNLDLNLYQIFTWKGYINKDFENINPLYLNSQGDKGNTLFAIINPKIEFRLSKLFEANLECSYYIRSTHYSYHKDVLYRTFETRFGLVYDF